MNLEQAQQKIRLFRKINEQSHSFRPRDYNNFYEHYPIEDLESVQDIILEYEQIKVSDIISADNQFFILYGTNYTDKYLVERTETCFKVHFEFKDALFYKLLYFFKDGIERFIDLLPSTFSIYSIGNNSYSIPYSFYQEFFTNLQDEGIKEAIRFLNRTTTFSIVSDYDQITTNIYVGRINNYLNYAGRYSY